MDTPKVVIKGTEYELATTLRVAYKVQGLNSHKPYSEIFSDLNKMPIEKQIEILYTSFAIANPFATKEITSQVFLDYYLDNYNISIIMDQLQSVIGGILGQDIKSEVEAEASKAATEQSSGN